MANITVKNIPRRLHEVLKRRAVMGHRSLNNEIISSLETATGFVPLDAQQMAFDAALMRHAFKGEALPEDIDRFKKEGQA